MRTAEMGYGDRLITGVGANRIRPVRQTGCRTDKAGEWAGLKLNVNHMDQRGGAAVPSA